MDSLEIIGITDNQAKPISVTYDHKNYLNLIWDKSPNLLNSRCPIQIIEDKDGILWISLLKKIDFENGIYENIIRFENFIKPLMTAHQKCNFMLGDIIRNPSIKEYEAIEQYLKQNGFYFNKKTNKFMQIK